MSSVAADAKQRRLFLALWPNQSERLRMGAIAERVAGEHRIKTDNLHLTLVFLGATDEQQWNCYDKALADLSMSDRSHHKPDQLSGGQRQRVAIARATVTEPNVLLADEPTGNLDHQSGNDVIRILEQLNQRGITLIMVTHDPEMGERARRQLHMMDGRLQSDNSTDQR